MASSVYNRGKKMLGNGDAIWGSTTIGVILVASGYTPDVDHNFVSDLTAELSGGNYVRKVLASKAVTENDTDDRFEYAATAVTWTALEAAAGSPTKAIIYDNTNGSDATRDLIAWIELQSPPVPNGGDYVVQWDQAAGVQDLIRLT